MLKYVKAILSTRTTKRWMNQLTFTHEHTLWVAWCRCQKLSPTSSPLVISDDPHDVTHLDRGDSPLLMRLPARSDVTTLHTTIPVRSKSHQKLVHKSSSAVETERRSKEGGRKRPSSSFRTLPSLNPRTDFRCSCFKISIAMWWLAFPIKILRLDPKKDALKSESYSMVLNPLGK